MAENYSITTTVTTEREGKHKTLVLRHRVREITENVMSMVEKDAKDISEQPVNGDLDEMNARIDQSFGRLKNQVERHFDDMKQEVQENAPERPQRKPEESEEEFAKRRQEYEAAFEEYREYVARVAGILKGLVMIFDNTFDRMKDFFRELWNLVKGGDKNIPKRISDFMKGLKQEISSGTEKLVEERHPEDDMSDESPKPKQASDANSGTEELVADKPESQPATVTVTEDDFLTDAEFIDKPDDERQPKDNMSDKGRKPQSASDANTSTQPRSALSDANVPENPKY
ncbi:hypothetical protein BaRGS_00009613 [Batillaria attramentaria]|uniref:Uncharacterized protein n=1 Tax=Batillaria attramentaria TaxID=370345 RepID=A0ABD0LIP5_9CAEN